MVLRFKEYWTSSVDESYVTTDFYIDIGKETCPQQLSKVIPQDPMAAEGNNNKEDMQAETLLYKRCCLESYSSQISNSSADEGSQKQVFYLFTMLGDSRSLMIKIGNRLKCRSTGLLYSQFYPSIKEVFAVGNIYPFANTAIKTLTLDKKLRKTWELVGGGLSY
ncbi:hypothetical protein M431DRAFT_488538 [Trichoderma harzianum CBS 226.95]|uniref:Uncharacterized protein n=1 Tax=Trichoderma harzianum CBS 226.95 TaxID=983964 RepID=A0A2T3ZRR6_TRIHA|nr:hypothetical protein M431DRAFT_488538 [Trichoderma harzianum CBS 226.95]PTB47507.1 hypothetical protein M431DRAFT_488538 [Trichoderma harzianum CBS 226.95]